MEHSEKKYRFNMFSVLEDYVAASHREYVNDSMYHDGSSDEFLKYMLFRIKESKDKLR